MMTAGCAQDAAFYPLYEYEDLTDSADIVISADVLSDRRDLLGGLSSRARIAELRVTAVSKGDIEVGDEVEFHYDRPQNSNFSMEESQTYIVFAAYYFESNEAYAMSDAQGIYGESGNELLGFDDGIELPPQLLKSLG